MSITNLEQVRAAVIAADADGAVARRWRAESRRVRVFAPDVPGQDFNNRLLARSAAGVPHA
jgi:hypothetical protein